ncbi:unnamed protein product, partial [marine sediment metagenome]
NEAAEKALKTVNRDAQAKERMEKARALHREAPSKALEIVTKEPLLSEEEHEKITIEDAKLLIEHRLGTTFDPNKIKGILDLRAEFIKEKRQMDKELPRRGRSGKEAALEINERFRKLLNRIETEVGRADYEKLFGRPPDVSYTLGDPEIAGTEE